MGIVPTFVNNNEKGSSVTRLQVAKAYWAYAVCMMPRTSEPCVKSQFLPTVTTTHVVALYMKSCRRRHRRVLGSFGTGEAIMVRTESMLQQHTDSETPVFFQTQMWRNQRGSAFLPKVNDQIFFSSVSVVSRLDTNQYTLVASTTAGRTKSGGLRSNRAATNRPVLLECLDPPHFDEQDPPVLDRLSRTQTSSLSPSIVTDCQGHDTAQSPLTVTACLDTQVVRFTSKPSCNQQTGPRR